MTLKVKNTLPIFEKAISGKFADNAENNEGYRDFKNFFKMKLSKLKLRFFDYLCICFSKNKMELH